MGPDPHAAPGDPLSDDAGLPGLRGRNADAGPNAAEGNVLDPAEVQEPMVPVVPSDEAELVAAAKAGDLGAFEQLVKRTYADVYTLAYRLTGNEEDARDVAQEACLRAWRGIKKFRGDSRFSTWMYRITANCASTLLVRRSKGAHEELNADDPIADQRPEVDPQAMAEAGYVRDRMTAALAELPPRLRAVVVLRDIYDLPHEAIAAELGISQEAAKVRLHRARRKLRERLFPLPGEERARAV